MVTDEWYSQICQMTDLVDPRCNEKNEDGTVTHVMSTEELDCECGGGKLSGQIQCLMLFVEFEDIITPQIQMDRDVFFWKESLFKKNIQCMPLSLGQDEHIGKIMLLILNCYHEEMTCAKFITVWRQYDLQNNVEEYPIKVWTNRIIEAAMRYIYWCLSNNYMSKIYM